MFRIEKFGFQSIESWVGGFMTNFSFWRTGDVVLESACRGY